MRRYNIVSGILLILSIIGFALAAPVLKHEKHQARVDVVHIPRDVTTVLGGRGEETEMLVEFFKSLDKGKQVTSSGAGASSNKAPLGLDHESTNEGYSLALSPASSTAEPNEPWSPSSTTSYGDVSDPEWWFDPNNRWHSPTHTPTSTDGDYDPFHELAGVPAPNPRPSKDPDFGWNQMNFEESPPPKRPKLASSKEFGQTDEYQPPSNPGLSNPRLEDDPGKNGGTATPEAAETGVVERIRADR
jgi:hypothetical protein